MAFIRTSLRKPCSARNLFTASAPAKRTPVRTAVYTTAFVLSAGLFAVYYSDARSALHRYVLTPILRNAFDPETGHKIAIKVLKSGLAPRDLTQDDKVLDCQVRLPLNTSHKAPVLFFLRFGARKLPIQLALLLVLTRRAKPLTVCLSTGASQLSF